MFLSGAIGRMMVGALFRLDLGLPIYSRKSPRIKTPIPKQYAINPYTSACFSDTRSVVPRL